MDNTRQDKKSHWYFNPLCLYRVGCSFFLISLGTLIVIVALSLLIFTTIDDISTHPFVTEDQARAFHHIQTDMIIESKELKKRTTIFADFLLSILLILFEASAYLYKSIIGAFS